MRDAPWLERAHMCVATTPTDVIDHDLINFHGKGIARFGPLDQ